MRIKVDDEQKTYLYQKEDQQIPFILLGENGDVNNSDVIEKIHHDHTETVPGFWGTLGHAENKDYKWSGHIECSGFGNEDSTGITLEEVKDLYKLHNRIEESGKKVIERYIDLDFVDFEDYPKVVETEELPELRLTIFLEQDEGAEVYLQHYTDQGDDADLEYIMCEPTTDQETNMRDRLTYNIPIIPKNQLLPYYSGKRLKLSEYTETSRFVIKILTFKRELSENSNDLLNSVINRIIDRRFRVSKFDAGSNSFSEIGTPDQIDESKKTLILIHGTIASVNGSFRGLLEEPYKNLDSWLKYIIESDEKNIEQIIGVDHDTLTKTAIENADEFIEFLDDQIEFEHPVTLISTSRGGLIVKTLCGKYNNILSVDRAILIACANYCGYFVKKGSKRKKKRAVSMLVTGLLKMILGSSQWWQILKFLSTQSYSFILSLPGLESMTEGSSIQKEIQSFEPSDSTKFYPIIGKEKAKKWYWGLLGKIPKMIFVNRLLKRDHDWVLGTEQQFKMPPGSLAEIYHGKKYNELMVHVQNHTTYLSSGKADINNDGWDDDVKHLVENYLE